MKETKVRLIPLESIRVVNPRVRDAKVFQGVVDSIASVGLKKPITVTRRNPEHNGNGTQEYDLVCGQGRLEAFRALGATEIPALICDFSSTEGLLASLVENLARRRVRPVDQIKLIQWMKAQGDNAVAIAAKTGLTTDYIRHVFTLLERGEERLLDGVLHGRIPISIAIRIAGASDPDAQRVLLEAFEHKELTQRSLTAFRKILDRRRKSGRQLASRENLTTPRDDAQEPITSARELVTSYKRQAERQKLLIKKAKACETRLITLIAAFKTLRSDENYVTLLRAEQLETMPKFLLDPS